jgi:Uma2 family endonuclease
VLSFEQVATKTQIRAEDYLRMTFEHDAVFVHGQIIEASMPDYMHGRIEYLLGAEFSYLSQSHPLYPCVEVRMKIAPETYCIPDFAVFAGKPQDQRIPDTPPLLAVEILSKDDRHVDLMKKLEEYRLWGVPHIWFIDPLTKRFSMYTELGLQNVSSLALPEYPFQLTPAEFFANL